MYYRTFAFIWFLDTIKMGFFYFQLKCLTKEPQNSWHLCLLQKLGQGCRYGYMRFIFQISVYKYSISKDLRFDLHSFVNIVDKLLYWYMCTLQFSCAAPIDGVNNSGYREVWVCNSDGYVGHMCLLSLQPEPIVTLNTPVPGCNARILCICAVPAYSGTFRR